MAIQAFRIFANQLREPAPSYFPMITELKGASNLVIGSGQFVISLYMQRCSNTYYNSLADRHFEIGTQAMKLGITEFVPGILAAMSLSSLL